jgi:hypothetical protein
METTGTKPLFGCSSLLFLVRGSLVFAIRNQFDSDDVGLGNINDDY